MTKTLTVYQHANYGGAKRDITGNVPQLPAPFESQLSSARLGAPAAFFTGRRYAGDVMLLTRDTPRFSAVRGRNLNDVIRSIRYEPLRLRMNVVIGVDEDSVPAKTAAEVAEQVATCNEIFGEYGIEVEAGNLRAVSGLAAPMTAANQDRLIAPFLRDDAVNVLSFRGTHWKPENWGWVEQSVQAMRKDPAGPAPSAQLFPQPNYAGTVTRLNGANTVNINTVRSIRLGANTSVAVYSGRSQSGDRIDLFDDEPDLGNRHVIKNWWSGGKIGHCCHGPGKLIRNNQFSGQLTLAHEVGHWMSLPHVNNSANLMFPSSNGGTAVTFAQAEQAWSGVVQNAARRRALI